MIGTAVGRMDPSLFVARNRSTVGYCCTTYVAMGYSYKVRVQARDRHSRMQYIRAISARLEQTTLLLGYCSSTVPAVSP